MLRDCSSGNFGDSFRMELLSQRRPGLYQWNFKVYPGIANDLYIKISAVHQDASKNPIRIEFNPEGITADHIDATHEFFALLFNDAELVGRRDHCRVTRADIAIDLMGLRTDEVVVTSSNKRKGNIWTGRTGEIETIYCGTRGSRNCIRAYQKPWPPQSHGLDRPLRRVRRRPRIRAEVEWKPYLDFYDLYDAPNPLRGLLVSYLPEVLSSPALSRHESRHFIDSCFRRGPQGALALIDNEPDKRRYRRALGDARIRELDIDVAWEEWPAQVNRILYILGGQ